MKRFSQFFVVALVSLGFAGLALANLPGEGGPPRHKHKRAELLKKFDKNGDGKLDDAEKAAMKAELQRRHEERKKEMLARYDANKNGVLDPDEKEAMKKDRQARRKERMERMFTRLDTDGDGKITPAEAQASGPRAQRRISWILKYADQNGDGAVDRKEIEDALAGWQ